MKIGFIGLGAMGNRMAIRLLKANHDLLVYNRSSARLKPVVAKGARSANSVSSMAREVEYLFTSLSMPADTKEVYLGEEGILAHAQKGLTCVDFTTVDMETSREVYREATTRGVSYLDAPVSGGPEGAEGGTLTIMVGGDGDAFTKVEPLLKILGQNVEHLGGTGLGSAAKLINQYLVGVHILAAAEAMAGAGRLGLDEKKLYNLLRVSYGQSRMLERLMEQFVIPDTAEPGAAMKYIHKDLRLANVLLASSGIEPETGKVAFDSYERALQTPWGEKDMAALYYWLREKANV
jgi:3-hydroxyisobutyrate dehydrogenase